MKKELNTNNSKKLIIGTSIIFCTIILIIGTSLAYFTQSDSKELGNIVSSNDNNTYLKFEEYSMMLDNLIPMKSEDINEATFENEGEMCIDANGQHVCSVYAFMLENTYGDFQKINISMIPTANSFTNLKYVMYKFTPGTEAPELITEEPVLLEKNNFNPISLMENMTLFSGEENMVGFYIFFYIESKDYDQTEEDAGKHFGATIKVDSLTTGKYITKSFGDSCWDLELIDGTIDEYKLTKFKGIENSILYDTDGETIWGEDKGIVKEECSMYVSKDTNDGYYTIDIPSSVGGYKITTLGNFLLSALDMNTYDKLNSYRFIKEVNIQEGITKIEDGATFMFVGINEKADNYIENFELKINLPNGLEYIGDGAMVAAVKEITIPKSVKQIGNTSQVFSGALTKVTFEGASDNTSNLEYIGDQAFYGTSLDYQEESNPLIIPKTVKYIGSQAFDRNNNLKFIKYTGDYLDDFASDWYNSGDTKLIETD